jgi:hypothetical protein
MHYLAPFSGIQPLGWHALSAGILHAQPIRWYLLSAILGYMPIRPTWFMSQHFPWSTTRPTCFIYQPSPRWTCNHSYYVLYKIAVSMQTDCAAIIHLLLFLADIFSKAPPSSGICHSSKRLYLWFSDIPISSIYLQTIKFASASDLGANALSDNQPLAASDIGLPAMSDTLRQAWIYSYKQYRTWTKQLSQMFTFQKSRICIGNIRSEHLNILGKNIGDMIWESRMSVESLLSLVASAESSYKKCHQQVTRMSRVDASM